MIVSAPSVLRIVCLILTLRNYFCIQRTSVFAPDLSYAQIICRLENLFLLYETFLSYERSGIDIMLGSLNNFTLLNDPTADEPPFLAVYAAIFYGKYTLSLQPVG